MLSNAYFLAKFRFDTAENEPAKNLQNPLSHASLSSILDNTTVRDPPGFGTVPRPKRRQSGWVVYV